MASSGASTVTPIVVGAPGAISSVDRLLVPLRLKARAAATGVGRQLRVDCSGERLPSAGALMQGVYPLLLLLVRHAVERCDPAGDVVNLTLDARIAGDALAVRIAVDGGWAPLGAAVHGEEALAAVEPLRAQLASAGGSPPAIAEVRRAAQSLCGVIALRPVAHGVELEASPRASMRTTRVLFVDDALTMRKLAERFLNALGAEVDLAPDGEAALARLQKNSYDIVFTDLEMPRMTGFELVRELRRLPGGAKVPVVVVTSRSGASWREQAIAHGANEYLTKPFSQASFTEILRRLLAT